MMFELAASRLALPYAYSNIVVAAFCTAAGRVKLLEELVLPFGHPRCEGLQTHPFCTATRQSSPL
jgi:hypothetical protein